MCLNILVLFQMNPVFSLYICILLPSVQRAVHSSQCNQLLQGHNQFLNYYNVIKIQVIVDPWGAESLNSL